MKQLILILFCWASLISSVNATSTTPACEADHCLAIVDAGSSGSRLHIYAFDLNGNTPINIKEIWFKKIRPGFSDLAQSRVGINNYLNRLFADLPWPNVPIYFYATGGMRLLTPNQQQFYQSTLEDWFAKNKKLLKQYKVITGKEEGIFGWLATNYALGNFTSANHPLIGVMDMGGASVQVVFPLQQTANITRDNQIQLEVYGHHLTLFVHSFLGLGQNALAQQFLETESCFSVGYPLPNGLPAQGDAQACMQDISTLINERQNVNQIVRPALAANPVSAWYVIGGLSALAEEKPFHFERSSLTNLTLLQQGDEHICHKEWNELFVQYPSNQSLARDCLLSCYYYALMVNGYGIDPQSLVHYLPQSLSIDWTLGAVILIKLDRNQ